MVVNLFLSGEFSISMPLCFATDNWQWTMTPTRLEVDGSKLLYRGEEISGVIHYADCADKKLEFDNLHHIAWCDVPCWPDPYTLIHMLDRHVVMEMCIDLKLTTNDQVHVLQYGDLVPMGYPYVLKVGQAHRGEGKYLIKRPADLLFVDWPGDSVRCTVEPFYEGRSVRALAVGDRWFGLEVTNDQSWIKNTAGAEVTEVELPRGLLTHANEVKEAFELDVAGIDYIVRDDGSFEFLEVNQYPGLGAVEEAGREFLKRKMYGLSQKKD